MSADWGRETTRRWACARDQSSGRSEVKGTRENEGTASPPGILLFFSAGEMLTGRSGSVADFG
jgi:hypothetical protein